MFEDRPNRDIIERAENLIVRLREVQSCRIYSDESGNITEVHVVAVTSRMPKLIARDVETCLKASLNLTVDYRKIGVVVIDPEKNTIARVKPEAPVGGRRMGDNVADAAADHGFVHDMDDPGFGHDIDGPGHLIADEDLPIIDLEELVDAKFDEPSVQHGALIEPPPPEIALHVDEPRETPQGAPRETARHAPRETAVDPGGAPFVPEPPAASSEPPSRIEFKGLRVTIEETRVDVEVRLSKGPLVVTGSQGDFRFNGKLAEAIAGATLHAISELLDEDIHLCLAGSEEVVLGGRDALCVVVNAIRERSVTSYIGCALIGAERNECVVLAVLDALNRPLGEWKLRTEIHYTIR